MAYELRNNSGTAFKNRRKEQDSHPDLTGEMMVDNKMYWLNVKIRKDRNGDDWHSIWLSEKKPRDNNTASSQQKTEASQTKIDDDIPF